MKPGTRVSIIAGGIFGLAVITLIQFLWGEVLPLYTWVIAVVGCCTGCLLCLDCPNRRRLLFALIPVLVIGLYRFTYLVPPDYVVGKEIWLLVGVPLALEVFVLSGRTGAARSSILIILVVTWWSFWGIAMAASVRVSSLDTPEMFCASNLKIIASAGAKYSQLKGKDAVDIKDLVKTGLIPEDTAKCPLGTPYVQVNLQPKGSKPDECYILVCPNHKPDLLLATREGAVRTFPMRWYRPLKFGPDPW